MDNCSEKSTGCKTMGISGMKNSAEQDSQPEQHPSPYGLRGKRRGEPCPYKAKGVRCVWLIGKRDCKQTFLEPPFVFFRVQLLKPDVSSYFTFVCWLAEGTRWQLCMLFAGTLHFTVVKDRKIRYHYRNIKKKNLTKNMLQYGNLYCTVRNTIKKQKCATYTTE